MTNSTKSARTSKTSTKQSSQYMYLIYTDWSPTHKIKNMVYYNPHLILVLLLIHYNDLKYRKEEEKEKVASFLYENFLFPKSFWGWASNKYKVKEDLASISNSFTLSRNVNSTTVSKRWVKIKNLISLPLTKVIFPLISRIIKTLKSGTIHVYIDTTLSFLFGAILTN